MKEIAKNRNKGKKPSSPRIDLDNSRMLGSSRSLMVTGCVGRFSAQNTLFYQFFRRKTGVLYSVQG